MRVQHQGVEGRGRHPQAVRDVRRDEFPCLVQLAGQPDGGRGAQVDDRRMMLDIDAVPFVGLAPVRHPRHRHAVSPHQLHRLVIHCFPCHLGGISDRKR